MLMKASTVWLKRPVRNFVGVSDSRVNCLPSGMSVKLLLLLYRKRTAGTQRSLLPFQESLLRRAAK